MKKAALIGKGYWGTIVQRYIPKYFDLKYIADSTFDLETIWNDEEVEAVIIVTPVETHYPLTKAAILHGKHVFVEKPVTTKYEEALELEELAKEKNRHICVEYTQTFSQSIQKIASMVKAGEPVKYIEMSVKHLGRFLTHDVYWLLASHQLSILGMIYDLKKFSFHNIDHLYYKDLCTTGTINFESAEYDVKGRIEVSINFPGKEIYAHFYSGNTTIKYEPQTDHSVKFIRYNNIFHALPPELTEEKKQFQFDERNNLQHAMAYFRDVLDGKAESNMPMSMEITKILEVFARENLEARPKEKGS